MTELCDQLDIVQRDFRNPNKSLVTNNKSMVCDLRPHEFNKDNMPAYRYFYDEELRYKIEQKFTRDIEFFNYKFED